MTKSEKLCKQMLEKEGYQVEKAIKTQFHRNDLFSLWDIIAVKPGELRFIQVSSVYLSEGSHAQKDYHWIKLPEGCTKEFWRWDRKKKEFKISLL